MATFEILTEGCTDIIDITDHVRSAAQELETTDGVVHIFVPSTTSAVTVMEYEPGAIADLKEALQQIAPETGEYHHNEKWGDGNGYAHVRSALLKPQFSVPIVDGELQLGTWQSIVLIDFDNKQRTRTVFVQ